MSLLQINITIVVANVILSIGGMVVVGGGVDATKPLLGFDRRQDCSHQ